MSIYIDDEVKRDKFNRARAALNCYVKDAGLERPRPDGEEDYKLNSLLDRLAMDLIELSIWFSECAAWTEWASQPKPPRWAIPFLSQEELAGLGIMPKDPKPIEPDPVAAMVLEAGKKKKGRKKKKAEPIELMTTEQLQFIADHYDDLPTIDHRTGKPAGQVL